MDKVYIGYVQGVHGLKGDLKIKCRFEKPDRVFQKGNRIFLNDEEHTITDTKFHKGFYLVIIDDLKDINLVEKYKGFDVYFLKDDLKLNQGEYVFDELYDMEIVYNNKSFGTVVDILTNKNNAILVVDGTKKFMIPLIPEFIEKVDIQNKKIYANNIEGLILWK